MLKKINSPLQSSFTYGLLLACAASTLSFSIGSKTDHGTDSFSSRSTASDSAELVKYEIEDGWGKYTGTGKTKTLASADARTQCVLSKVISYEQRYGRTPDTEIEDNFYDACINK